MCGGEDRVLFGRPLRGLRRLGLGGGKQGQSLFRLLALFLQRKGHGGQFILGSLQPLPQGFQCRGIHQTRGLGLGQALFGPFGTGLKVRDQRLHRGAAGGGKAGRFGRGVHLVPRLGQCQLQRLLFRQKLLLCLFKGLDRCRQVRHLPTRRVAFGQKRCDLRLETGDAPLRRGQIALRGGQLPRQRGDQRGLPFPFRLRRSKRGAERTHLFLQPRRALPFKAKRIGKLGDLVGQAIEFVRLRGDGFPQHDLHDGEDRQHEHHHHQQRGHRIHETGPDDRGVAARAEGHDLAPPNRTA